jgi:hypothetical protein
LDKRKVKAGNAGITVVNRFEAGRVPSLVGSGVYRTRIYIHEMRKEDDISITSLTPNQKKKKKTLVQMS